MGTVRIARGQRAGGELESEARAGGAGALASGAAAPRPANGRGVVVEISGRLESGSRRLRARAISQRRWRRRAGARLARRAPAAAMPATSAPCHSALTRNVTTPASALVIEVLQPGGQLL